MEKYQILLKLISEKGSVLVAFSGGVDSALVAMACKESKGTGTKAIMFDSEAITRNEIEDARSVAEEIGIPFEIINMNVLTNDAITRNAIDRCGICKEVLMSRLLEISEKDGFSLVADGANSDDPGDYRPGLASSDRLGIWHPLMEAGIGKEDARDILKDKGISIHDKPSTTCLMTRIPYDERITKEKMDLIERVEHHVRKQGFKDIRLRLFERGSSGFLGVLEVDDPSKAMRVWNKLDPGINELKMTLDPSGYRQGSMNKGLVPP